MICPRCESFAALVGELTLDRDHLRNELNKRKGDIVTTNNPGVVEQIRAVLDRLLKEGDPFDGDDWELVQQLRRAIASRQTPATGPSDANASQGVQQ